MYKHILFDLDMTILDTKELCIEAFHRAFVKTQEGHIDKKNLEFILSHPLKVSMLKLKIQREKEFLEEWIEGLKKYYGKVHFFPGMKELLYRLKSEGYSVGMVTSRTREEALFDLERFDMKQFFSSLICSDDVQRPKPHPESLYKYMKETGGLSEELLFVGDTQSDADCASSAGIDFALAGWGALNAGAIRGEFYRLSVPEDIYALVRGHITKRKGRRL
ncbi:MAG: HAD family hydrolase [Filifactor alocis]|nr:HAD family hydrolase [Filifactor alocis]